MKPTTYKYRFSLFTSTYNRCDKLKSLYDDIVKQDYKGSFEWIIVSDGSTDNTVGIVNEIMKTKLIPIKFINKENGGKHTAWRVAAPLFEGRYVLTLDDDDPIPSDTLSIFDANWSILEKSPDYDSFWEIKSRCQYEDGQLVGLPLAEPYLDADYNEICFKYKNLCEMDGCRKVEILNSVAAVPTTFYFEDKASNYPEHLRWSKAARRYKTRFIPAITRTYIVGHESLSTKGKSNNTRIKYNSLVDALYTINEEGDLLLKYGLYTRYLKTLFNLSYKSLQLKECLYFKINSLINRILYLMFLLPAFVYYIVKE